MARESENPEPSTVLLDRDNHPADEDQAEINTLQKRIYAIGKAQRALTQPPPSGPKETKPLTVKAFTYAAHPPLRITRC